MSPEWDPKCKVRILNIGVVYFISLLRQTGYIILQTAISLSCLYWYNLLPAIYTCYTFIMWENRSARYLNWNLNRILWHVGSLNFQNQTMLRGVLSLIRVLFLPNDNFDNYISAYLIEKCVTRRIMEWKLVKSLFFCTAEVVGVKIELFVFLFKERSCFCNTLIWRTHKWIIWICSIFVHWDLPS